MAQPAFDPDKYLNEKMQVAQNDQAPAFDPDAYLAEKTGEQKKEEPGMFRKGLETTARVLDYPGGFMRAGLASAAGLFGGKPGVVTEEDLANAAKGQGPSSAEYLKRLGLDEGPSANVPFLGKTSARDVEGFGLDVVTDPLTVVAKGARKLAGPVRKLLSPVSEATEKLGEAAYKSGLKKIDEKLVERGAKPVSEILMAEGKTGTTKTLAKDAEEIGASLGTERAGLYDQADKLGAKVDMEQAFPKAEGLIAKYKKDPGLRPMAEAMEETLNRYKAEGAVDMATASEWKTNLYNSLPQTAFDQHGKLKGPAKNLQKAMANDFKSAIVETGNKAEPGLGGRVNSINEKWQSIIQAGKPFENQIRKANTPNAISSVDAMIGGYGIHDPATAASILAIKKAADAAKTTYARTKVGAGLMNLADKGLPDALIRRGLINNQRPSPLNEQVIPYVPLRQAEK